MNQHQPRFSNGAYRDCKWCHGKGCLSCEAEADKEYHRQFPDGPRPIASFSTADLEGGVLEMFKSVMGPDAIMSAKNEAKRRASEFISSNPQALALAGCTKEEAVDAVSESMVQEVIQENIVKLANDNPLARKFINKNYLSSQP